MQYLAIFGDHSYIWWYSQVEISSKTGWERGEEREHGTLAWLKVSNEVSKSSLNLYKTACTWCRWIFSNNYFYFDTGKHGSLQNLNQQVAITPILIFYRGESSIILYHSKTNVLARAHSLTKNNAQIQNSHQDQAVSIPCTIFMLPM